MIEPDWKEVRLGEYVEVTSGYAFDSDRFTENTDDIPLVKGSNVQQGYIDWDESKYWPADDADDFDRFFLEQGDVVLAMDRPWVEDGLKWAWIKQGDPPALLVQRIARLRSKDGLDQTFLRYIIGSTQFENYIRPIVTGVNVPHISGSQIEDFEFSLPPLEYQRQVASIISKFDDLIENNQSRMNLVGEMAQLLYQEWFENYNYPGYEEDSTIDSSLGSIPEKWTTEKLSDIATVNAENVTNGSEPDTINYINIGNVEKGEIEKTETVDYSEAPSRARRIVTGGDVIWSSVRPNLQAYALVLDPEPNTIASTGFAVLTANTVPWTYLYCAVTTNEFVGYLDNRASGAAYPSANVSDFKDAEILVPNSKLLDLFDRLVKPLYRLRRSLKKRNLVLSNTRDLIQKRLISGELDITDLDTKIGVENQ